MQITSLLEVTGNAFKINMVLLNSKASHRNYKSKKFPDFFLTPFRYLRPRVDIYLVKSQNVTSGPPTPLQRQANLHSEQSFSFDGTHNTDEMREILV